jgi:hypothetical protein
VEEGGDCDSKTYDEIFFSTGSSYLTGTGSIETHDSFVFDPTGTSSFDCGGGGGGGTETTGFGGDMFPAEDGCGRGESVD